MRAYSRKTATASPVFLPRGRLGRGTLMADLSKNQINDFKVWFKPGGDPGFSVEKNKQVIEDSIKEYELKRTNIQKKFGEDMMERSESVAYLLKAIDRGRDTNAQKYFGKSELARLRGEQIVGEMRIRASAMKRQRDAEKK